MLCSATVLTGINTILLVICARPVLLKLAQTTTDHNMRTRSCSDLQLGLPLQSPEVRKLDQGTSVNAKTNLKPQT